MTTHESLGNDAMLIAYADGELDPLAAKRVEQAMADDPALAATVEAHRALRGQLGAAFAPVADEPVPDRLTAMLSNNVVAFAPRPAPPPRRWLSGLAVAASLVVGIALGRQSQGPAGPVASSDGTLVASGELARALETRLTMADGSTRMIASFRDRGGVYCRVFVGDSLDGIACKRGDGWQLRQTRAAGPAQDTAYRQAGFTDATLMAAAQDMMAGEPLDAAQERSAIDKGWR